MSIEIIKKDENKLRIKIEGINYSIANAIRRSSYEIMMPAVHEVEFHANDSVLYDEIIANRLCLIPLVLNRQINSIEKCSCKGKGCSKCTLKIKIDEKGEKGGKMVYGSSIKGEAKPLYEDMPLVWLEEGQKLRLIATVRLGKALEHAKYQAGLITYNPVFILKKFDTSALNNENVKKVIEKTKLQEKLEKLKSKSVEIDEKEYEMLSYLNEKFNVKTEIEISENDFVFDVETFSYLKPIEILLKAIDALNENLSLLDFLLKK